MGAPENAEPIVEDAKQRRLNVDDDGNQLPTVTCDACNWKGGTAELLGIDPDEDQTMWCPRCGSIGWMYD